MLTVLIQEGGEEDPWAVEFKNLEKEVYGMRKEYNNRKAEFDRKQRELRALEDSWDDLKKEAVKPNSEEVSFLQVCGSRSVTRVRWCRTQ